MIEQLNISKMRPVACAALSVVLALGMMVPVRSAEAETAAQARAKADAALANLNSLYEQAEQASEAYNDACMARDEAKGKADEAQKTIDEETKKIAAYQEKLSDRVVAMYRSGSTDFLDVFLGSSTFEEFATSWNLLETMNENDAQLVSDTKESRAALEEAKVELDKQVEVATKQANEAKKQQQAAEAATARAQETYDSLDATAKQLLEEEEAAKEAAARAAAERAAAEQAAQRQQEAAQQQASQSHQNNNGGSSQSASSSSSSSASAGGSTNNSKPQSVSGGSVVSRAYNCLGIPYVWGACSPSGMDCSGLVSYCLTGRYSRICTSGTCAGWTRVSDPKPGDICVKPGHVGVYVGGGMMIHAPHTGTVVKVAPVMSSMYYVRY